MGGRSTTMKLANREVSHGSPLYERVSKRIRGRFRYRLGLHRLRLLVHAPKGCRMGQQLLSTVRHLEAMEAFLCVCEYLEGDICLLPQGPQPCQTCCQGAFSLCIQ